MMSRFMSIVVGALLVSGAAVAQQNELPPIPDNAPIFGSQLMTVQERGMHQVKMRTARTLEEREQIRAEHHKLMLERARERGVTLPEEPPARGGGMGPGPRMGPGGNMGQRGAMGPGGGAGQRGGMGPGGGMGQGRGR